MRHLKDSILNDKDLLLLQDYYPTSRWQIIEKDGDADDPRNLVMGDSLFYDALFGYLG